ncbi:hypothetical protein NDN08_004020 [Rhodosorus marinus]|uniref:Large ribosomal subunit protein eL24-related N-terminal domain-containing protein n=1 Tax=Rhodosorus marinus TaxID=101924 RepID=A0AAV8UH30_9RHOD|nr:hypothetical protein NDN08_004020 [Rhodosorus marinus]
MVVKTEVCNFSGFKIYPGHGSRFARTDEKVFNFINGKSKACQKMKRKPVKLNWTQLYRRVNKKGAQEETVKRRTRKVNTVVMKPVEGASLEVIKAKRNQQQRSKATGAKAANLKEIKARKAGGKTKRGGAPLAGKRGGPQAPPPKKH